MTEPVCECRECSACIQRVLDEARRVLDGAEARLSAAYGFGVSLRVRPRPGGALQGGHVEVEPTLPRSSPQRSPAPPEDERHARARALLSADIAARLALQREHIAADRRALADELAATARRWGCSAEVRGSRRHPAIRIHTPNGQFDVRCEPARYTTTGRTHAFSGPDALRAAVVGELACAGRLDAPTPRSGFVLKLLDGEPAPFAREAEHGLVDRLGLLEPDEPAAWLRGEIRAFFEYGPCPGGLGSPVAVGGVAYRSGRLVAIDGVLLRHVDVEALSRWRIWATARARARDRPLTWHAVTWGVAVDPGGRLPFARDGPVSADVVFDRHRRMYARASEPGPDGRRLVDWGRREAVLPLDPPPRARGAARDHYEAIARHWMVGWSLAELAEGSGASRSAVDRLIRSARQLAADPAFAGPVLAIDFDRVVVTPDPGGEPCAS